MFRDLITSLCNDCEFKDPASDSGIVALEESLGIRLPNDLKDLIKESNGIYGKYRSIVWSVEQIRNDNIEFRTQADFKQLYMPFDCLLFFADDSGGDQFAFVILDGEIRNPDIFVWNHENDSRVWAASNLKQYLEFLFSGKFD